VLRIALGVAWACLATAVAAGGAGATPSAIDLTINAGAADTNARAVLSPNGTTLTVTKRDFWAFVGVSLAAAAPAGGTFEVELGQGLSWGADAPDPTEGCTSTAPTTGRCQVQQLSAETGGAAVYFWNVTAAQNGTYTLRAELVATSDTDSDPSNNATSITIVVAEQGGGGGGGGSAGATASAAKIVPAKPKAGSTVAATVRVRAGGTAVRPSRIACSGAIGSAKVAGTPRAASGSATCTFRAPRSAKGKTLRGSISFTARGTRFTKRFAAKLG
jgi:hypothetical protein